MLVAALAGDQFITALAWGIAALKNVGDLRARAKEQGCFSIGFDADESGQSRQVQH